MIHLYCIDKWSNIINQFGFTMDSAGCFLLHEMWFRQYIYKDNVRIGYNLFNSKEYNTYTNKISIMNIVFINHYIELRPKSQDVESPSQNSHLIQHRENIQMSPYDDTLVRKHDGVMSGVGSCLLCMLNLH